MVNMEDIVKYRNDWRDKRYKRFELIVPLNEEGVINKLKEVDNRSSYIIELVKKDIEKKGN